MVLLVPSLMLAKLPPVPVRTPGRVPVVSPTTMVLLEPSVIVARLRVTPPEPYCRDQSIAPLASNWHRNPSSDPDGIVRTLPSPKSPVVDPAPTNRTLPSAAK